MKIVRECRVCGDRTWAHVHHGHKTVRFLVFRGWEVGVGIFLTLVVRIVLGVVWSYVQKNPNIF